MMTQIALMIELFETRIKEIKENYPKVVGKRVREIRNLKNITQVDLANATGKDRQYIYKIEKGIVTINIATLKIITTALDITLEDFFKNL